MLIFNLASCGSIGHSLRGADGSLPRASLTLRCDRQWPRPSRSPIKQAGLVWQAEVEQDHFGWLEPDALDPFVTRSRMCHMVLWRGEDVPDLGR
jgi:hypothetical protein